MNYIKTLLLTILLTSCSTEIKKEVIGDPIFDNGTYYQSAFIKLKNGKKVAIKGFYKFQKGYSKIVFKSNKKNLLYFEHGRNKDILKYDKNLINEDEMKIRFLISAYESVFRAKDHICNGNNCLFKGYGEDIIISLNNGEPEKLTIIKDDKSTLILIDKFEELK